MAAATPPGMAARSRPRLLQLALAAALALGRARAWNDELTQFLIVSQPVNSKVVYLKINGAPNLRQKPKDLIAENLQSPLGLAVDGKLNKLYVADPGAKKIQCWTLAISDGNLIVDGLPEVAASSVEARWVAVDGTGNVFFSDMTENRIGKLFAERLALGDIQPEYIYEGGLVPEVSSPSGIAVDNLHVFWANRATGLQAGSIIQGYENPPDTNVAASAHALAHNTLKAFGVCVGTTNVFYTGGEQFVYGVKKAGGPVTTVTDKLLMPRGCVWDGDGTIYVADKGAGAIYGFAGQMHDLQAVRIQKAFNIQDPFGLAMYATSSATPTRAASGLLLALLVLLGPHA